MIVVAIEANHFFTCGTNQKSFLCGAFSTPRLGTVIAEQKVGVTLILGPARGASEESTSIALVHGFAVRT